MELKKWVYEKLDKMKIPYYIIDHEPMFSEKDTNFDNFDNNIIIGKNLFLRNKKKSKYYLIILPLNKKVNLQELAMNLNENRLSFANEMELYEYLRITPGSVSYLNVITSEKLNGKYNEISYIIDNDIMFAEKIGFHPSDNTVTVVTTPESILKVFEEYNLKYSISNL